MKKDLPLTLFFLTEVSVLVFILATAGALPETVASHFNAAGMPNGFMPKQFYVVFMLVFALGIPSIVSGSMALISRFPDSKINLPNKQVWLSEKYRESTFAYLKDHALGMGALITLFMGYVHWLVIKANSEVPAYLSSQAMIGGLVIFVVALIGWGVMLPLKFMRLPK